MKNIALKAELNIENVLSNLEIMQTVVENGSSSMSQMINSINISFQKMSLNFANDAANIESSISRVTDITNTSYNAFQTMSESISKFGKYSESVQLFGESFINASGYIEGLTQKVIESNLNNHDYENGFSTLSGVVQMMTENIDMATVSTSFINFAMEGLKDPIGAVIEIIGGLIGGLNAVGLMFDSNYQIIEKDKKMIEDYGIAVQNNADAYSSQQTQNDKQIESDLSIIENKKRLYDELLTIVDASGLVTEGYEGMASFILGELNDAFGTNYQIVDGVIQGLGL